MRPLHLAAVIGVLGWTIAGPAAAQGDTLCVAAKAQVAALQAQLPIEVDAVTATTAATASCENKVIRLERSVALKQSRMEADFKDFLQKQDNDFVCTDKSRRTLVNNGWTWSIHYTFQDGNPVIITASCGN